MNDKNKISPDDVKLLQELGDECPHCNGEGTLVNAADEVEGCKVCAGLGIINNKTTKGMTNEN